MNSLLIRRDFARLRILKYVRGVQACHHQVDFHKFEAAIAGENAVVSGFTKGGGIDHLLKVVVPDFDAYQNMMDRLLIREIGIERYFTCVTTNTVKESNGMDHLE